MLDDKELCGFWQDVEKRYAKKGVSDLLTELAADVAMRWVSPGIDTEQHEFLKQHEDLRKDMFLLYHALVLIRDRVDDGKLEGVKKKEPFRLDDLPYYADKPEGYYKTYDEYPDIINVDKTKDIPIDYEGIMGVPITIIDKPEIIAHLELLDTVRPNINGSALYKRFLVRWIWTEQLQALMTGEPLVVSGAYHSAAKWAEEHGIEMRIEK